MASVKLTAEEAVCMARAAAEEAPGSEGYEFNDPNALRAVHAGMTPYVDLIRELQDELEVTHVDTLRAVAQAARARGLDGAESDHRALTDLRDGKSVIAQTVTPAQAAQHGENLTTYIDEYLDEAAIAASVLKRIEEVT